MKAVLSFLILVLLSLSQTSSSKFLKPRIIGGQEATPHSIPYQAFLLLWAEDPSDAWSCGGTLISQNYVLTTGFCTQSAFAVNITLGAHNIMEQEDSQITLTSIDITVHEDFDGTLPFNDIAVIKLPQPVVYTHAINSILLPSYEDVYTDFSGTLATTSGWGIINNSTEYADVLHYVQLTIISREECENVYGPLDDSVICTISNWGAGICGGDMGGPLVTHGMLVGVASFTGQSDCGGGLPSGFVRVTYLLDWIAAHSDIVIQ